MNFIVEKYQKLNKIIKCFLWLSLVLLLETKVALFLLENISMLFEDQILYLYDNFSYALYFSTYFILSGICYIPIIALLIFLLSVFEKNLLCKFFSKTANKNLKLLSLGFLIGMIEVIIPIFFAVLSGAIEITTFNFTVIPFICFFPLLLAAFYEEVCTRLCVYGILSEHTNSNLAILFSVIFFLLPHIGNFRTFGITVIDVVSLAVGAIAYCLILEKSKSLMLVTGIHFGWNFPQLYIFNVGCSGMFTDAAFFNVNIIKNNFFYNEAWGVEGSWIAPIMDALLCIGFLIYYRRKEQR